MSKSYILCVIFKLLVLFSLTQSVGIQSEILPYQKYSCSNAASKSIKKLKCCSQSPDPTGELLFTRFLLCSIYVPVLTQPSLQPKHLNSNYACDSTKLYIHPMSICLMPKMHHKLCSESTTMPYFRPLSLFLEPPRPKYCSSVSKSSIKLTYCPTVLQPKSWFSNTVSESITNVVLKSITLYGELGKVFDKTILKHPNNVTSSNATNGGTLTFTDLYSLLAPQSSHTFIDNNIWLKSPEHTPKICLSTINLNDSIIQSYVALNFQNSVTDSTFIFIFKVHAPVNTMNDMRGMAWSRFLFTRSILLLVYACVAYIEYSSYRCARRSCLGSHSHRLIVCLTLCAAYGRSAKRLRRLRHYLARYEYMLLVQVAVSPVFLLLLLCGDVHPNPGPILPHSHRHPDAQLFIAGSWNVRTLLDTKRTAARPTAIVARELDRYNIDIAALSETRILGDSVIEEAVGGYTFFLKGNPEGGKCYHGVGFAVRTKLVKNLLGKFPIGVNERLMHMTLPLQNSELFIISAYAPTLGHNDEEKERFYSTLGDLIKSVPPSYKLLILGDFNARVGRDFSSWENVIGKHGIGRENSNGTLLLSLCSQYNLTITNTIFQQATRHKTTWMHPRTKEWHLIDYAITRQMDVKDVHHTRAMCGSCTWSDHRLVKCKLALRVKETRHLRRQKSTKKLNIDRLKSTETRALLSSKLREAYTEAESTGTDSVSLWNSFKNTTLKVAEDLLGSPGRKHRDWFDENDPLIRPLLTDLHDLHVQVTEDRSNDELNLAYRTRKQEVQKSLRNMQNTWWKARAADMQDAADKRDYKTFYQSLKAIHGPKHKASPAIKSKDGVLLTDPAQVLDRWSEHFNGVLNLDSEFDMSLLDEIPQWDMNMSLVTLPTLEEILGCIKQITSGKAPGSDGIPPDIFKHGGTAIAEELLKLFTQIWKEGGVPQDFKDADIVHLYKNKGDIKCCDNHRGISLLCIAGKLFARLLLNRLFKHADDIGVVPESQCGFRPGRGTNDMNFALRQIQEKCRLYGEDLYLLFIDLTKAFDTVNRQGLWEILNKIGCPPLFVDLIRSFHDGMQVTVREGSDRSQPFGVTSGTKQGCVLAPTLFSIFFSVMLHVAFKDATDGVVIKSRFDRSLCSLKSSHFNAPSKVKLFTIRDLLFADDCALAALSQEALQRLCDCFASAARRFGLTISIKKTETLYQPAPGNLYVPPAISIDEKLLNAVDNFKYLGSIVSNDATFDEEITARIAKATAAFGRLSKRLWTNCGIKLNTKICVYKAAVLTSLLYGCETWTLTKKQVKRLEKFHQTTLRKIARIKWFHKVTNYDVLSRCSISSLQSMIDKARLRWTGHVVRMKDDRIPKALLYGRLSTGIPKRGNHNTYLNSVKSTLRECGISSIHLEELASDRAKWRHTVKTGIAAAEVDRTERLIEKRLKRKARADLARLPT